MRKRVGFGAVNGFGIGIGPCTHFLQHFLFKIHHTSITPRTDIEQVITTPADYFYQAGNFLIHFVLRVSPFLPRAVAPCFVEHGSGCLPRYSDFVIRILIIGHHTEIHIIIPQPSAYHAFGLQAVDQLIQSAALLRGERSHIKPDFRDGSVISHDFFHLFQIELVMFRCQWIGIVARNGVGLREMPVDKRKIHREINTSALAGFGQLFHQIPLVRCGIHNVETGIVGVIHAKSVVVLGGENDGAHAGFPGESYDAVGVPVYRIELPGCIGIPVAENSGKRLNLFAVTAGDRFVVVHTSVL